MPRGGSRPGERRGGRKPGTGNKDKQAILAKAKEIGKEPLEVMLIATKHFLDTGDYEKAGDMASKAAPYIHRKMPQAVETKDTTNETWEQLLERVGREKARASKASDK